MDDTIRVYFYRFKVNTSSFSKQLPTLIMFQDGKEKMRRPVMSAKGTVIKHTFTKVRYIATTILNSVCNLIQ